MCIKKKTLAQLVREKYGDNISQFADRLHTSRASVVKWEKGTPVQCNARALLNYAWNHELNMISEVSDEFAQLPAPEMVKKLRANFGDTQKQFAARIGVTENLITRLNKGESPAGTTRRLLLEVAAHPERFATELKSFKK